MKLGDATREYVANKKTTGMVFDTEAYILRALTEKLGPNVPIKKITSDSVLDYLNGHGPLTSVLESQARCSQRFLEVRDPVVSKNSTAMVLGSESVRIIDRNRGKLG